MALSSYFAPRYFAIPYFQALQPVQPPVGSPQSSTAVSDRQILAEMIAALGAARLFERIEYPDAASTPTPVPPSRAWVRLSPAGWSEHADSRGRLALRTFDFSLALTLNQPDRGLAISRLDQLATEVQDLLETSTLGGLLRAGDLRITRGKWGYANRVIGPELKLDGHVHYLVQRA